MGAWSCELSGSFESILSSIVVDVVRCCLVRQMYEEDRKVSIWKTTIQFLCEVTKKRIQQTKQITVTMTNSGLSFPIKVVFALLQAQTLSGLISLEIGRAGYQYTVPISISNDTSNCVVSSA